MKLTEKNFGGNANKNYHITLKRKKIWYAANNVYKK